MHVKKTGQACFTLRPIVEPQTAEVFANVKVITKRRKALDPKLVRAARLEADRKIKAMHQAWLNR